MKFTFVAQYSAAFLMSLLNEDAFWCMLRDELPLGGIHLRGRYGVPLVRICVVN